MSNTVKEALNFGNPTDLPQLLGRMNIGSLLEKLVTPTVDANARTVTTHVCLMVNSAGDAVYGTVHGVEATAGGTAGAKILTVGTAAAGAVKVEYLSTGQPKLTFNTTDAITACKVIWTENPLGRNGSTVRAVLAEVAP